MALFSRRWSWAVPVLLCAAAASAPAAAEIRFQPCELRGSAGHGRVQAECADFEVPENPELAHGRTLVLKVARVRAPAGTAAADPITLINGGPGASSIDLYVDLEPMFGAIRRQRDVVLVDQRGTGASGRLDCASLQDAADGFDAQRIRDATAECLADLTADPRYYTTSVAVGDLEALRRALGIPAWHLYGVSYGTRVALHYARRHPEAVRTLTLDGVLPPGVVLGPEVATNAQHTLDGILERCRASRDCAGAFPDLARDLAELGERLHQTPVNVSLVHPISGRPHEMRLGYAHLAATLRLLSYAPETSALIPLLVHDAARRHHYMPVAAQALRIEHSLKDALSFGMHNSVVCSEDAPRFGNLAPRLAELDATYLGSDQMRALVLICEQWPSGPVDADFHAPLEVDVPALLLSGEHDPITPPRYAEMLAADLPRARHLVAPGQGHGVIARGCVAELVEDFIATGSATGLDAGCLGRLAAEAFFIDPMGPPP
jgi:pimeloyl-ACP methyl ester carboxylesterase